MRFFVYGISVLAVVAATSASAAWKEYKYEDLGIAKEFPAEPKMETVTYKTPVAGTAMAHRLSAEEDGVKYIMTVVDLQDKVDRSASIMGECISLAEGEGKPVANMEARVEFGANAVYGRIVSADSKDGSRSMTECLYTKGRLYKIQAIISMANSDYPNSSEAIRFINSLAFNLAGEGGG